MKMERILVFSLLLIVVTLPAEWIAISPDRSQELFTCEPADLATATVTFTLDGYELENIEQEGLRYSRISYGNEGRILEVGKPDLPCFTRLIAIPERGEVSFEILSRQEEVVSDILVYPQQELRSESEPYRDIFVVDRDFYETGAIFPGRIVNLGMPAILRDLRVVALTINPFRYDPANRELTVVTDMEVKVTTGGSGGENQKTRSGARSRFFEPLYRSTVLNYEVFNSRDDDYQQPAYLYIYPNNSQIQSILQALVDWKHQKGFQVVAVNTVITGSSSTQIKNYIQNAYDNWESPPEFVCLVGDANGTYSIPTWFESWSGYGGEGDQPYTQLEGNDVLADIFIGRLSISGPTDLQTIINKIMNYEREPYLSNTNWYNKAIMVGDPTSSGESCVNTKISIRELMEQYSPNYTFQEVYSGSWVSQMTSGLNGGVSYFNYRGYVGMSGWTNSNTNGLNNGFMLPFVVTLTCGTGDYYNDTAISEAFLRAGNPSTPKGGIAAVGTATWGTHTVFNNCVDAGTYFGLFADGLYNPGGALTMGKLYLYLNFPNNLNYVNIFSHWNNLMGDPGTELWSGIPQDMTVVYDNVIGLGSNYISVGVYNALGLPLTDAWVSALKGDDEIFVNDFTDQDGMVYLPLDINASGAVSLTVTKHNFIPYLGSFNIVQQDVTLKIRHTVIDDDMTGTSSGNADGELNPGESIELGLGLQNTGMSSSGNVTAVLSTNSPLLVITDDTENYGIIPAGEITFSEDDFDFTISPAALGGEEIHLILQISDTNGGLWTDHLFLQVQGSLLVDEGYDVLDGGNGILDPDETAEFTVDIFNLGTVIASDVTGYLSCSEELITVEDSVGYYGDIEPGSGESNSGDTFQIKASGMALPGMQIPLTLHLVSPAGYDSFLSFLVNIGQVTVNDPLGPDAYGYFCYDSGDQNYDIAPEYVWIEIDPTQPDADYNGTTIPMYDNGNDGDTESVPMPFTFNFYGMPYDQITICSNGWLTPGSTDQYTFMNWHIPGPLGPSPIIAPFWDDLEIGGGHVCYHYVEEMHYFIVEWSDLDNNHNGTSPETCEVIIYDPNFYPTPSGDAELLFQYKEFNNIDSNTTEGPYCTVGIEDHTGFVGLEYTFRNLYPTAARTLQDGSAIFFTTRGSIAQAPAQLQISQNSFDIAVSPGGEDNRELYISNVGEQNLYFNFVKQYIGQQEDYSWRGQGGPDNYGYQWIDSNEPEGPAYSWRDITGLGTQVTFSHNDVGCDPIPLPFTFNFYGTDYDQFHINPNGWIGFGVDSSEWLNTPIPSVDAPRPALMPYWDDLYPWDGEEGGGDVYYFSTPDSLVVWFDHVIHYPGAHNGTYNFQMIIYPDGEILYQYESVSGDIDTVTMGIQNESGDDGLQIAYNMNYVENQLAIRIKKIIDWIDINPASGMLTHGQEQTIILQVTAAELELGEYLCNLLLYTNDPNANVITIPVDLLVVSSLPDIDVSSDDLDFGSVEIGTSFTDTLVVANVGADPLEVYNITVDNEVFSVNPSSFQLLTGEEINVLVTFSPLLEQEYTARMFISSNDPDEPEYQIDLQGYGLTGTSTGNEQLPGISTVFQNYPNPFNPDTKIGFYLTQADLVSLLIYNIRGEKVAILINEQQYESGFHEFTWQGTDSNGHTLPSGIYFYNFRSGSISETRKMILIK